jgi:hypothetical protein
LYPPQCYYLDPKKELGEHTSTNITFIQNIIMNQARCMDHLCYFCKPSMLWLQSPAELPDTFSAHRFSAMKILCFSGAISNELMANDRVDEGLCFKADLAFHPCN